MKFYCTLLLKPDAGSQDVSWQMSLLRVRESAGCERLTFLIPLRVFCLKYSSIKWMMNGLTRWINGEGYFDFESWTDDAGYMNQRFKWISLFPYTQPHFPYNQFNSTTVYAKHYNNFSQLPWRVLVLGYPLLGSGLPSQGNLLLETMIQTCSPRWWRIPPPNSRTRRTYDLRRTYANHKLESLSFRRR